MVLRCPLPPIPTPMSHSQRNAPVLGDQRLTRLDATSDLVDLRLAESYAPLCMCIAKCTLVFTIHSLPINGPVAHAICVSILIVDRISQLVKERIVDSNSMAWAVLCLFMTGQRGHGHTLLFTCWLVMATIHTMYGGVPIIDSNPSTAFWPGLRDPLTNAIPMHEVAACAFTTAMVTGIVSGGDGSDYISAGVQSMDSWDLAIPLRIFAYFALSSLWSYTIIVIGRKGCITGACVAKVTSVLTATRFMLVFYIPIAIMIPWSVVICVWISWVSLRHTSMTNHPKKRNEV